MRRGRSRPVPRRSPHRPRWRLRSSPPRRPGRRSGRRCRTAGRTVCRERGDGFPQPRVGGRDDSGGRQSGGDLVGEVRPGEDSGWRPRHASVTISSGRRSVSRSTPLAQTTNGPSPGGRRPRTPRRCWVGTASSARSAVSGSAHDHRNWVGQRTAGQVGVLPAGGDCRGAGRVACPQGDAVAGSRGLDRERRSPGTGADHRDATHRRCAVPLCPRRVRDRPAGRAEPSELPEPPVRSARAG